MRLAVTVLVFCVAALLALGLVMLYSSSMARVGPRYLMLQSLWCVIGLVACVIAACVDYHVLKKTALPLLGLAVVLLALVLVVGRHINGATRWFDLKGVLFQPSEFAKIALIVALAWYGERFQRQMPTWKRGILVPGLIISLVLGLIFIEPDRGATILLAAVSGIMLLIAGVRWKYLLPPVIVGMIGLAISLLSDPVRLRRLLSWLHPEETKLGAGYQVYQGVLALGAGGWTGRGLGNGRQTLGNWVPFQHSDFILATIGEQLGLIATLLVIAAFVAIVICGICIAFNSRDTFGLLLASGITFLIGLQAFINIGVVTNTLPNKGLPLPFISYGGSNLLLMLSCVGVLLNIARQARSSETVGAASLEPHELPSPQRA